MDVLLGKALRIAQHAHEGQTDYQGDTIFRHVLRVYSNLDKDDRDAQLVALLHDTVEDSDYTVEDLSREGFPNHVVEAVQLLTHDKVEPYMDYVHRLSDNSLARRVKLADLKDNTDPKRLEGLPEELKEQFNMRHEPAMVYLSTLQWLIGDDEEDSHFSKNLIR